MRIHHILNEAAAVLHAAQQYESELSKVGFNSDDLFRFRSLIVQIALDQYSERKSGKPIQEEIHELEDVKDVIIRNAQQRFGEDDAILQEFRINY